MTKMIKILSIYILIFLQVSIKANEIEYMEGTEMDRKYVLPQVNLSVSDGSNQIVKASLSRALNFFNTELLTANWDKIKTTTTEGCRRDMQLYVEGLNKAENWALKMDDASGRYTTGWFWGNHYWTGSQSLCENISPKSKLYVSEPFLNRTRMAREASTIRMASNPSQSVGYTKGPFQYTSLPPFPVSFFMLRLELNSSFTAQEKILHLGLCMPYICTNADIKNILEKTAKELSTITLKVEAVKSHHDRFNFWQDRTFIALCGATSVIVIMLFLGTCYDFWIEYQEKNKQVATLETVIPNSKTRSSVYVVNNNQEMHIKSNKVPQIVQLVCRETLLAFSLRINIKTICDQSVSADTIPIIHGLKTISMAWVILGHTCLIAFKYSDNMEFRKVVEQDFFFQTISNAAFSVDTFFFTSGLLVSFLYFRTNAKGKLDPLTKGQTGFVAGLLHFFGLILYRFARLTVPYLVTLGIVEVTMKWFFYNSIFEPPAADHINCPNYWWRNILYVNTLFPMNEMCMLWSWYLSDDTQFYIVGAVMLILTASHFKSGASLLLIFLLSSWLTTGYISYSNSYTPDSDDPLALFDKIYDKPWTRLGPYLIGMSVGWFLFKKNCELTMSKTTVIVGWCCSLGCLLALVYGLYEVNLTPVVGAAYSSLSHSAWALSLAWVVIACSTGYGGVANTILSATILYPFSRITYCAYLLHPLIMRAMTMTMDSPLHLGTLTIVIIFFGQIVASYALSFAFSLAFEAPVVGMLRILSKVAAHTKK